MSLFNGKKALRAAAVILSLVLMLTVFAACGGETKEENENSQVSDKSDAGPETETATPEPTPVLKSQAFVQGVGKILRMTMEESGNISSAQLDLLFDPASEKDDSKSNYTKSAVTLNNPVEGNGEDITVILESILDASTGDTSMALSFQSGSEVAQSGGLYFTGDKMLLKRGDAGKPMIQHAMDPIVAESFAALPAPERFGRILSDMTAPKLQADEWAALVDGYMQVVLDNSEETNYSPGEEEFSLAGAPMMCETNVLNIMGEGAVTVLSGLIDLMAQDSAIEAGFITFNENPGEADYVATGLEGMTRDVAALTADEIAALNLYFKLITLDGPVGAKVFASVGDKTFALELMFYENGHERQKNIAFKGFDGSSVKTYDQNVSVGGDDYEGQVIYESLGPSGVPQENSTVITKCTITDLNYALTSQLSYDRAAAGGMDAMTILGTAEYSQQESGDETTGVSTGVLTVSTGDETSDINFDMMLEQSSADISVTEPDFLPAAGISTSDEASLFAALENEDLTSETYNYMPASIRALYVFILLLM